MKTMKHSFFNMLLLAVIAGLIHPTHAFWRLICPGRLQDQRIDPIISPGEVSAHVHAVAGGNGFNWTMDYAMTQKSTCSSCGIRQDLSNYWTPKLYYHNSQNGTFTEVPVVGDMGDALGGMTIYYLHRSGPNNDTLHAFPEGFRMIAGNPFQRNFTDSFAAQAVSFSCVNLNGPMPVPEGNRLPDVKCPNGVRVQVFFPSCWDGVHLDPPDHQSHMSYPASEFYDDGPCPASHPKHMMSLFYELYYQTQDFSDMWHGDKQPFVFAMGDPTGYGFHGDFINGWDVEVLQKAADNCLSETGFVTDCPYFDFFSDDEIANCRIPRQVHEQIKGPLDKLPGCNPIQHGPGEATNLASTCPKDRDGTIGEYFHHFTDLSKTLGWRHLGCATDDSNDHTFPSEMYGDPNMTLAKCVDHCHENGYRYAGAEFEWQCYCSNKLRSDRMPRVGFAGACDMACYGDKKEICGGLNALSVYERCTPGDPCYNAKYEHVG